MDPNQNNSPRESAGSNNLSNLNAQVVSHGNNVGALSANRRNNVGALSANRDGSSIQGVVAGNSVVIGSSINGPAASNENTISAGNMNAGSAIGVGIGISVNGPAASNNGSARSVNNLNGGSSGVIGGNSMSVNGDAMQLKNRGGGLTLSNHTRDKDVPKNVKWVPDLETESKFSLAAKPWAWFFSGFFTAVLCYLIYLLLGRVMH